jgi:hypothetical protein
MAMTTTAMHAGRGALRAVWRNPAVGTSPRRNFDIPDSLLAEVDFKWLMAGHGWHVDMARFLSDPAYAAQCLDLAMNAGSPVLRESAASLLAQIERTATPD